MDKRNVAKSKESTNEKHPADDYSNCTNPRRYKEPNYKSIKQAKSADKTQHQLSQLAQPEPIHKTHNAQV